MVEVVEIKQGVWIDATLLKLAGLGTRLRIVTQPGEIRLVSAKDDQQEQLPDATNAWAIFCMLGKNAPRGKLVNSAENHDRYLYGR